jgi:polysaccharide biosynthesis protein PslH
MKRLPSMLFVAPIMPAATGNGLAMRAGVFLDALAGDFAVSLLVIPVAGGWAGAPPHYVAERTTRAITLRLEKHLDPLWELVSRVRDPEERAHAQAAYPRPALCRYATTPCLAAALAAFAGESFAAVHVMRSYLVPYAAPFLSNGDGADFPRASLDLDDDETVTHRRLAALH